LKVFEKFTGIIGADDRSLTTYETEQSVGSI